MLDLSFQFFEPHILTSVELPPISKWLFLSFYEIVSIYG